MTTGRINQVTTRGTAWAPREAPLSRLSARAGLGSESRPIALNTTRTSGRAAAGRSLVRRRTAEDPGHTFVSKLSDTVTQTRGAGHGQLGPSPRPPEVRSTHHSSAVDEASDDKLGATLACATMQTHHSPGRPASVDRASSNRSEPETSDDRPSHPTAKLCNAAAIPNQPAKTQPNHQHGARAADNAVYRHV